MPAKCRITNKKLSIGNKVSHSNSKSKRAFRVNLQSVSLYSDALKNTVKLTIAASTIRTVEKNGGLDSYILNARAATLSSEAITLRKKIRKALENSPKAA